MAYTKKELVEKVASKAEASKKVTEDVIGALFEVITEALVEGESVSIPKFGTFSQSERAARTGVNPSTKEKIEIKACKTVKWKASKNVKDALNG